MISDPPPSSSILTSDTILLQPSQFILAWDRHQIFWLPYPVAWLRKIHKKLTKPKSKVVCKNCSYMCTITVGNSALDILLSFKQYSAYDCIRFKYMYATETFYVQVYKKQICSFSHKSVQILLLISKFLATSCSNKFLIT